MQSGVFSIRRPRGKAKASSSEQSTLQEKTDELKQLVINLSERVIDLEKGQAATEAEKVHLVTRIASLELQVARLKKVTKP